MIGKNKAEKHNVVNEQETIQNNIECRKHQQIIQLIEHENIVMNPSCTLKTQLRIKNTNIYLDETVTLIQYIQLTSALLCDNHDNHQHTY